MSITFVYSYVVAASVAYNICWQR